MREIRDVRQLPDWFNLSNYQKIRDISEFELHSNIDTREWLYRFSCDSHFFRFENDSSPLGGFFMDECESLWETIQKNPILDDPRVNGWPDKEARIRDVLESDTEGAFQLIGIDYCLAMGHELEELGYRYNDGVKAKKPLTDWKKLQKLANQNSPLLHNFDDVCSMDRGVLHLSLDLDGYNDKEILKSLKEALPALRKRCSIDNGAAKNIEEIRGRIIQYQIVPLIDLLIWSKWEEVTISNSCLASALFPFGEKGESTVCRTIKPFAERVLSTRFLNGWKRSIKVNAKK